MVLEFVGKSKDLGLFRTLSEYVYMCFTLLKAKKWNKNQQKTYRILLMSGSKKC